MEPMIMNPRALRRLADAIEAEDKAGRELWVSARRGEETSDQVKKFHSTVHELREARKALT